MINKFCLHPHFVKNFDKHFEPVWCFSFSLSSLMFIINITTSYFLLMLLQVTSTAVSNPPSGILHIRFQIQFYRLLELCGLSLKSSFNLKKKRTTEILIMIFFLDVTFCVSVVIFVYYNN